MGIFNKVGKAVRRLPAITVKSEAWYAIFPQAYGLNIANAGIKDLRRALKENVNILKAHPLEFRQALGDIFTRLKKVQPRSKIWGSTLMFPEHGAGYSTAKHEIIHAYDIAGGVSKQLPASHVDEFTSIVGGAIPAYAQQWAANPASRAQELLAFAHTGDSAVFRELAFAGVDASDMHDLRILFQRTRKAWPISKIRNAAYASIEGLPEGGAAAASRHQTNPAAKGLGPDQGHGSPWRGIIGVPDKLMRKIAKGAAGVSVEEAINELPKIKRYFGAKGASRYEEIERGMRAAHSAGIRNVVFIPTTKVGLLGGETKIKYEGRYLRSLIRHERTHAFNPAKGELRAAVSAHFKANPLTEGARESLAKLGYEGAIRYDEIIALASEVRYAQQFGKSAQIATRKGIISSYGEDVYRATLGLAGNDAMKLAKGASPAQMAQARANFAMQVSQNQVKRNTTGYTVGGLAVANGRTGGSRRTPIGGT